MPAGVDDGAAVHVARVARDGAAAASAAAGGEVEEARGWGGGDGDCEESEGCEGGTHCDEERGWKEVVEKWVGR